MTYGLAGHIVNHIPVRESKLEIVRFLQGLVRVLARDMCKLVICLGRLSEKLDFFWWGFEVDT
jgi:hypothetical protein